MPSPSHQNNNDNLNDQSQSSSVSTVIEVKQEKLSPNKSPINDSDIQCMGTMPDLVINIDDSISIEPAADTISSEETENDLMKMIEAGSQSLVPSKSKPADDTFKQLEPRALRFAQKRKPGPLSSRSKSKPKVAKPKRQATVVPELQYIDDDDESDAGGEVDEPPQPPATTFNGNTNLTSTPPPVVDVVAVIPNDDDISLFLSSQLIDNAQVPQEIDTSHNRTAQNSFTFAPPSATSTPCAPTVTTSVNANVHNMKTSFHAQVKSVSFIKNLKFEVVVNLRQFNLYEVLIADDQTIQSFFNITENCFQSLKNLLNALGKYEYQQSNRRRGRRKPRNDTIKSTVDQFFETYHNFNLTHFQLDGASIEISDAAPENRCMTDLTTAIGTETLDRMLNFKLN